VSDGGVLRLDDGRDLSWRASGPRAAAPLLWLHGSTGSSRTAPIQDSARVLAYDRPGYGGSSVHPGRTLRSDVADALALLDAQHVDRTAVLAFSGGAAVGYALAALAPDRVSRLGVVSGATWPVGPPPPDAALRDAGATLRAADPAATVAALAADAPPLDRQALLDPGLATRLRLGVEDAVRSGIEGWVAEARVVRTEWPFLPRDVRCPVLLWHGREDAAVPLAAAETTARTLPVARLHTLPGAGHLGWLAREDSITAAMVSGRQAPSR
jgi:pimeloyl-ACP methyl ester carboxylesterase